MGQWIDFKQLRSTLSFAAVLNHYKVSLTRKGDQALGVCPLPGHRGDRRSPSFSANLKRGIWQCFGCGARGNALDFAIRMEGLSPDSTDDVRAVALKLCEVFKLQCVSDRRSSSAPHRDEKQHLGGTQELFAAQATDSPKAAVSKPIKVNEPLDFELKGLAADHPYLRGRRFTMATIKRFGLGYCARGLMSGRVAIPLHDVPGRLVGYAGRVIDDATISEQIPKYKFPSDRERKGVLYEFRKSELLYNANRITVPVDHLVVVEGFTSVWWLDQMGLKDVVALMGSTCAPQQAGIILAKTTPAGRVSVMAKGNEVGEQCVESVLSGLGAGRWVRRIALPAGKQLTDCRSVDLSEFFRA